MSILGNRVLRREDPKLLTSGGTYVADLDIPGAAHVFFVRSTIAHGRVAAVDAEAARSQPGVLAVFSASDLDATAPEPVGLLNPLMRRPLLADKVVRFVGEPVLALVAESEEQAADAAELVVIEYDPLPPVVDMEDALRGETILFEEAGTNVIFEIQPDEDPALFAGMEVVADLRTVNQRLAPCPLEMRSAAAELVGERLRFHSSTQHPHGVKSALAESLGLEEKDVHVIAHDVGGGFGAKGSPSPEDFVVAWCARSLGRPVRWTERRSDSMIGLGHGRGQLQEVTIGGDRDGRMRAIRMRILQDSGAYGDFGAVLPYMTRMMASGVYGFEKVEFSSRSVVTNTVPTTAYRGAGRPEAAAAIERAVDRFAAAAGLDPAEVRRRNFVPPEDFPYETPVGTEYDCGDYRRAFELALEMAGYEELRAAQARRSVPGEPRERLLGVGLSSYVEITGASASEFGAVEIRPDGKAVVLTGTSPHGQGHETAWAAIVADRLGIAIDDVEVIHGDTDLVPSGGGTFGSRSLQLGGTAVGEAAGEVVERARNLAADMLEADAADIVFSRGAGREGQSTFHVAGTPAISHSWEELAAFSLESGEPLACEVTYESAGPTFPFGVHVAVVEVDAETGAVRLLRHIAVDDAGTLVNPLLAEGQVHGGVAQGAAQALLEEFAYDSYGTPLTTNFADYPFISATELPSFETAFTETPTPRNPLGAKGIGESGTIGSTPAVHNAVCDALSSLGVEHVDMPTTPAKVFAALRAGGGLE